MSFSRAVAQLFQTVGEMKESRFEVGVQFLELYNEEIIDLFDASRDPEAKVPHFPLTFECRIRATTSMFGFRGRSLESKFTMTLAGTSLLLASQ